MRALPSSTTRLQLTDATPGQAASRRWRELSSYPPSAPARFTTRRWRDFAGACHSGVHRIGDRGWCQRIYTTLRCNPRFPVDPDYAAALPPSSAACLGARQPSSVSALSCTYTDSGPWPMISDCLLMERFGSMGPGHIGGSLTKFRVQTFLASCWPFIPRYGVLGKQFSGQNDLFPLGCRCQCMIDLTPPRIGGVLSSGVRRMGRCHLTMQTAATGPPMAIPSPVFPILPSLPPVAETGQSQHWVLEPAQSAD